MPEGLRALVDPLAPWLLTYLLHSSVLIGAAWLLARTRVVRRPRTLDILWKAALMAGCVTSAAGVARAAPRPSIERPAVVQVRTVRELRLEAHAIDPTGACRGLLEGSRPAPQAWLAAVRAACAPAPTLTWPRALVLLWLGGGAIALLVGLGSRRARSALVARALPAGAAVGDAAARIATVLGTRAEVLVSDAVASPCALGRYVVLPPRCERQLTAAELDAVLAHELAHVARRDPRWLAAADLIRRIAWIQPLNGVAMAGLRDAAEMACDDRAVRLARPLDVARSIQRVSEWAAPAPSLGRSPAFASGNGRALSRRVRRVLAGGGGEDGVGRWRSWAAVGLLVGSAFLLPSVPVAREVRAVFLRQVEATAPDTPGDGDRPGERRVLRVLIREDLPGPR